jgi:hypothetical protein
MVIPMPDEREFFACPFNPSNAALSTHLVMPLHLAVGDICVDSIYGASEGARFRIKMEDGYQSNDEFTT